jgi:hypothetical protein
MELTPLDPTKPFDTYNTYLIIYFDKLFHLPYIVGALSFALENLDIQRFDEVWSPELFDVPDQRFQPNKKFIKIASLKEYYLIKYYIDKTP